MRGYAVIDVETTGLLPERRHRVAEIAIVHVDPDGVVTGEWTTLVNPRRDLGPQHVHRIRAADARRAPTFADVAGDVAARLDGRVLVAHNLAFDAGFVAAEFAEAGAPVDALFADLDPDGPDLRPPPPRGLCTMRLAERVLDSPSRSLAACCRVAGVPLVNAHAALDDARAAAGLLVACLRAVAALPAGTAGRPDAPSSPQPAWSQRPQPSPWPVVAWPVLAPSGRVALRSEPATAPEPFLTRLVDVLPREPEPPAADDYLALLDRALVGRHLSATDADALVDAAATLGLDRAQVTALHRRYVAALRTAARRLAPGPADTTGDRADADLALVAAVLGVLDGTDPDGTDPDGTDPDGLDPGGADPAGARHLGDAGDPGARGADRDGSRWGRFRLRPGDVVVFTGDMADRREPLERAAAAAGLTVDGDRVTRRTRLLVAADPDTLSVKAATARRYGVPVVTETAFRTLLAGVADA